jgi:transposase
VAITPLGDRLRLYNIDPYDYLVDVLQRVAQQPTSKVHELTPRLWKILFTSNPLSSDLYDITQRRNHAAR